MLFPSFELELFHILGKCTNPYIKLTESDAQLWMVRSLEKVLGKTKTKVMCSKASDKIKYTRPKKGGGKIKLKRHKVHMYKQHASITSMGPGCLFFLLESRGAEVQHRFVDNASKVCPKKEAYKPRLSISAMLGGMRQNSRVICEKLVAE